MKVEVECRGIVFFYANGYNQRDVVVGGDHRAIGFHEVIQLIFCNAVCYVNPYLVTIHVVNIDCSKDTREILQKTMLLSAMEIAPRIFLIFFFYPAALPPTLPECQGRSLRTQ
jgi:hypothetical protein